MDMKDGKTLAFVTGMIPCPLTTFIMSYALARGMLAAGLAVTAAMTLGMIATIGGMRSLPPSPAIVSWGCSPGPRAGAIARERFGGGWLSAGVVFGLWMMLSSISG